MLLLHGDSASALDWDWVLPALAQDARVLALDLPGHGDSAKPTAPYSPALFADTVIAFLDALGIDRTVLVGHSMGGLVAALVALRLGERISTLCLVASGGLGRYIHPSLIAALGPTLLGRSQRPIARAVILFALPWRAPREWQVEQSRLIGLPGFADVSLRTRRSAIAPWGQKEIILPRLAALRMPTLVVWGLNDVVVPVAHAYAAMGVLPDAELVVFANCGHMPQIERAQSFVDTFRGFLRRRRTV